MLIEVVKEQEKSLSEEDKQRNEIKMKPVKFV